MNDNRAILDHRQSILEQQELRQLVGISKIRKQSPIASLSLSLSLSLTVPFLSINETHASRRRPSCCLSCVRMYEPRTDTENVINDDNLTSKLDALDDVTGT